MQELHICLFLSSAKAILGTFTSLTFSVHSSTSLSTIFFQFLKSKYAATSPNLSHLHSQLLSFQINPLSHTPLSITS